MTKIQTTNNQRSTTNDQQPTTNDQRPTSGNKTFDIRERTFEFTIRILKITAQLPSTLEARTVRHQLSRCGASVGANVEESDGALTKPDKRKGFSIARKEAGESKYWLRIVERMWPKIQGVPETISEADELMKILSTIVTRLS